MSRGKGAGENPENQAAADGCAFRFGEYEGYSPMLDGVGATIDLYDPNGWDHGSGYAGEVHSWRRLAPSRGAPPRRVTGHPIGRVSPCTAWMSSSTFSVVPIAAMPAATTWL